MQQNPNISVYVDGGGTATGAQALAVGAAEICTASRPLRPEEVKNIVENHGTLGYSFLVAKEAIAIFLNQENPVETFTLEEIKQILPAKWTTGTNSRGRIRPFISTDVRQTPERVITCVNMFYTGNPILWICRF
ncbi:MAG: substrate-binding domain-containing protein [Deferribacteres bacterium]|nr:substrate-binding domain-containing protein [Deferribacteres bacterium]